MTVSNPFYPYQDQTTRKPASHGHAPKHKLISTVM
jgi:hypothetical protein